MDGYTSNELTITGLNNVITDLIICNNINDISSTELNTLSGISSNIQDQINAIIGGTADLTNINCTTLTASGNILSHGNITTDHTLTAQTLNLSGNLGCNSATVDVSITSANANIGNIVATNQIIVNGVNVESSLSSLSSGKQNNLNSSSIVTVGNITATNATVGNITATTANIGGVDFATFHTNELAFESATTTALNGKISTLTAGTVTTLSAGSAATLTIDTTDPIHNIINFGIPRGNTGATGATGAKGDKGDQGDKGDTGDTGPAGADAPALGDIITAVVGGTAIIALQAEVTALGVTTTAIAADVAVLTTDVGILDTDVSSLNARTINLISAVAGVSTTFNNEIKIKEVLGISDKVVLSTTGQSEFVLGIHNEANEDVDGNLTVGGTASITGNTTLSGSMTVGGIANITGNVTLTNNLTVGGNTTLDYVALQEMDVYGATRVSNFTADGSCSLGGTVGSLTNHTINGLSLTVTCPYVTIPALQLSGYFSQFGSGYSLSL